MSFWHELKRRRVVRVALVYLAAAFAALQAADILVPALHLPAWAVTLVVVLLAIGLPVALALAWVLELTPAGIRMTQATAQATTQSEPAAAPPLLGRRTILAAGVLVLAGLAFGAGWTLGPEARGASGGAADGRENGNGRVSVAVLPFADLSDDRSQEYFGDGIAEELLNTLRSGDIAVASRTSSFAFKGRSVSLREIAGELGVNHIVEGSVRKAGNRLRIAAQVVDVRSDRQLWSQTFDRDADDIFRIQDEIARSVASALRVQLAGPRPVQEAGTRSTEAYDLYLLGLFHWNKRTPEGLLRALDVFEAAAAADPGFARAWAGIAFTYYVLPGYADYDARVARARGMDAARRAVHLDPASAEGRTALGAWLKESGDAAGALREYDRAIELDSALPTAHHWRGILLVGLGRIDEGETSLRRAQQLDPASPPIQNFLATVLNMQRRTEEALAESESVLARVPGFRNALIDSFVYAAQLGRAREYEAHLRDYLRAIGQDTTDASLIVRSFEDPALRPAAADALDRIVSRAAASNQFYLIKLAAALEARELTLRMLEAEPDWFLLVHLPTFDFVRDDPRFQAVLTGRPWVKPEGS